MKILYALQATGNGHICRAQKIVPLLRKYGDVDVLTSGTESDLSLGFSQQFSYKGFSFVFGKKGGIHWYKTLTRNNPLRLLHEISQVPVTNYDFIINDFEPVTAWACKLKQVTCIAMSHQYALHHKVPRPKYAPSIFNWILRNYAPVKRGIGFHFKRYAPNIFYPIIRDSVRKQEITSTNTYTVYLPALSDDFICSILTKIPKIQWEVFSKHCPKSYLLQNILVKPLCNSKFQESMAKSSGILCGAGFETPAEALFLKKKLLVIPMRYQPEQYYNAAALAKLGVTVIPRLSKKYLSDICTWIDKSKPISISYSDDSISSIKLVLKIAKEN